MWFGALPSKTSPCTGWEGSSSCQRVVLAPPVLLGYVLFSETKRRIFQIPKILCAQQNQGECGINGCVDDCLI